MPTRPRRPAWWTGTDGAQSRAVWHLHWFRRVSDDPFSGGSLYACRCGVVRAGF